MSNTILIITTTRVEAQAVLELFPQASGVAWERRFIGEKTGYSLGQIGGAETWMVQSEMGSVGPGAALLTVHKALKALSPAAGILLGIACGLKPDQQQLGEVLVSRQIQAYEPQKVKGRRLIPRGDRVTASTWLLDRFRSGVLDWKGAKVHFGLVLSGEKLVASKAFRDRLAALEPEAIGCEMEGAGLYAAASDSKVDWILVKAICDWGDEKKDDSVQAQAARNAVGFVLHVLQQGGLRTDHSKPVDRRRQETFAPEPANSGKGPIFGSFEGTYVERDQINLSKYEDRHVEIHAPVSDSVIIAGDGNRVQTGPPATLEDFIALLRQVQTLLTQSGLPPQEIARLQEELEKVEEQAGSPQPKRGIILTRLGSVVEFLANSATAVTTAPQLLEMARQALSWAQGLFP